MNLPPLLIATANSYSFEDCMTGTAVDPADAIRTGFCVLPQESVATLRMIQAALAATPEDNRFASKWERVRDEGIPAA